MAKILLIAGLDPSGNAGLLRDASVLQPLGMESSGVVTALTAQSRTRFFSAQVVSPSVFKNQLKVCLPLSQYGAVKIGMLGNEKIVGRVAAILPPAPSRRGRGKIVLDPVYRSSTGGGLLTPAGIRALRKKLLPRVDLWTPNKEEAEFFWGRKIRTLADMENAARFFFEAFGASVYIKSFKDLKGIVDVHYDGEKMRFLRFPFLPRKQKTRGTGCALSSFIAGAMAQGKTMEVARKNFQTWLQSRTF